MSDRELVADLPTKLPEDASVDGIAEQIEFIAGIHRAQEQVRRGQVVCIEEARERIQGWARQ